MYNRDVNEGKNWIYSESINLRANRKENTKKNKEKKNIKDITGNRRNITTK